MDKIEMIDVIIAGALIDGLMDKTDVDRRRNELLQHSEQYVADLLHDLREKEKAEHEVDY